MGVVVASVSEWLLSAKRGHSELSPTDSWHGDVCYCKYLHPMLEVTT